MALFYPVRCNTTETGPLRNDMHILKDLLGQF